MSVSQHDWSLHRKGQIDQERHKEKIKEAKVFHSILDKAKKSMDDAGKTMEIRRDEGKERRYLEVGEMMNAKELKDEVDWQTDTVKHQKQDRSVTWRRTLTDSVFFGLR